MILENPAIEFQNVDVVFGKNQKLALEMIDRRDDRETILKKSSSVVGVAQANLQIQENKIHVLMGLSGSGKSTLLRCVNGLNQISRGSLLVHCGVGKTIDVAKANRKELQDIRMNHCSMVFQQFGLLPWSSVRENVAFGLQIKNTPKEEISRIVDEQLEIVRLSAWADKSIKELSGGMQQRVGLARALASSTKIILMDEPFSSLDPLIREYLQNELLELQKKLRKTIVFVSHDLNEALKLGDRIAIMKDGHIVQNGTAEEIVFHPVNDYVKKFVSSINPLTALNAGSLMQGVARTKKDWVLIKEHNLTVYLNDGVPLYCVDKEKRLQLNQKNLNVIKDHVIVVEHDCRMNQIIHAVAGSPWPLLVVKDSKLVGFINRKQFHQGLSLNSD